AAVEEIRAGHAEKIVLSERTTVRTPVPLSRAVLLTRLARAYPSTWVYLLEDVVGGGPEMRAQTEAGRVFSRVLAGARAVAVVGSHERRAGAVPGRVFSRVRAGPRPVAADGELDEADRRAFRPDSKELAEHAFAVASVVDRLEGLAAELEVSPEPFVLRLPGLEHLASDVSARLRGGATSLDVASRLHPSAAVSGTPREQADEIITELEPHDRGAYASPA